MGEHNFVGYFEEGLTVGTGLKFDSEGKLKKQGVFDQTAILIRNNALKNEGDVYLGQNLPRKKLREFRAKFIKKIDPDDKYIEWALEQDPTLKKYVNRRPQP